MRFKAHTLLKKIFSITAFIVMAQISFAQNQSRYNVIFISLDDMNDKCSILDFPAVLTPNVQRIAAHGMVFKNAYSNYPLCNPSRTSVLSGFRPDRTQVFGNDQDPRANIGWGVRFLPEYFHDYGYHTERYSKIMHGAFENECQWDYYYDWDIESPDILVHENNNAGVINPGGPSSWFIEQSPDDSTQNGTVARKTDSALRAQKTQPFFIGVGLSAHNPFTPGLKYWNEYGDSTVQDLLRIDLKGKTSDIRGNGSGDIALPQTPATDKNDIPSIAFTKNIVVQSDSEWRRSVHAYYSEVTDMDTQLGFIVDAIDSLNLWSNTVIVFWSDHGQHLGEHGGLWLKMSLFNESLHVPFIICAPGLAAGYCNQLVENVDIYPTLLDLCNLPPRSDLEGSSLKPLLYHPGLPWKKAVFQQVERAVNGSNITCRSVYTNQFHYNSWVTEGEELYDRVNDPYEYTNLFLNPQYAVMLDSMRSVLAQGFTSAVPPQYTYRYYYKDSDGDGYGNPQDSVGEYLTPSGFSENNRDCNDNNAAVNPDAEEIQDGIDNNCNGETDEGFTTRAYYRDADGDGFGNNTDSIIALTAPNGYVYNSADCNDNNIAVHPFAPEICDGIDNNCNGFIDDVITKVYYQDGDGDGYGRSGDSIITCAPVSGYVLNNLDCDDNNATVYPNAPDLCDGIDNNCNGFTDEYKLTATINPSDSVIACSQDIISLSANFVTGVSYQWYSNGSLISNATMQNLQTKKSGFFQVQESNGFNCLSLSKPTKVTRVSLPLAAITANGNLDICQTGSVDLIANNGPGYKYQWQRNNVNISGATLRTYTATTAGVYRVVVANAANCTKTSSQKNVTKSCKPFAVSGSSTDAALVSAQTLSVCPNPGNGKFFVSYHAKVSGVININIYDAAGQIIFSKKESALKGLNNYHIEITEISNGTFFLELKNAEQSLRVKLVVEK